MVQSLTRTRTLWILFAVFVVETLSFGIVMAVWDFTIIDETGQGYGDMIEASFQERRRERQREIIEGLSVIYGEDRIEAALSAFDQESDLEAARQAAIESLNLEQAQNSLNTVERTVIQVAPPAQNA